MSPPDQSTSTPSKPPRRLPHLLIWVGVLAGTHAACYLAGRIPGWRAQTALESKLKEAKTTCSVVVRGIREERDHAQVHGFQLEARRQVSLALRSVDNRNFGMAEEAVHHAARYLVAARPEGELSQLAGALDAYRLVATEDLGEQRRQLLAWLDRLDALVTPSKL